MPQNTKKPGQGFSAWMRGRYGVDELSNLLIFVVLVLVIINIFTRQLWLSLVSIAMLVYMFWRISSKNIEARRNENELLLSHAGKLRPWLRDPSAAAKEARQFKHVECPHCGQHIRVPRGKGNLRVTCPKCHTKFNVKA